MLWIMTKLDVVDNSTEGDFAQIQRVANIGLDTLTGEDFLTDLQAGRSDDVALLTVLVEYKGDTSGTVRIVFNGLHNARDTILVALEVNDSVHSLMAAASVANSHFTAGITTTRALLGSQ